MSNQAPTILFVEDDRRIREEVSDVLEGEGYRVSVCATVAEARQIWAKGFELLILDLGLPDGDGVDLCAEIRASDPKLPIMILSARDRVDQRIVGLDAGADDYLPKPFSLMELLARVRSLLRRTRVAPKVRSLEFETLRIDAHAHRVFVGEVEIKLKRRAFELLFFLASNPERLWSREELLEKVWGRDYAGGTRTVDVHIRRLRTAIESEPSSPVRIVTHYGLGYLFQVNS